MREFLASGCIDPTVTQNLGVKTVSPLTRTDFCPRVSVVSNASNEYQYATLCRLALLQDLSLKYPLVCYCKEAQRAHASEALTCFHWPPGLGGSAEWKYYCCAKPSAGWHLDWAGILGGCRLAGNAGGHSPPRICHAKSQTRFAHKAPIDGGDHCRLDLRGE